MRDAVSSVAEVAGSVAITVGAFHAHSAAGWVVGGVLSIVFGWRLSR